MRKVLTSGPGLGRSYEGNAWGLGHALKRKLASGKLLTDAFRQVKGYV
jgi:hypothetical protein